MYMVTKRIEKRMNTLILFSDIFGEQNSCREEGGHGRVGGGDRLPRLQAVRAELRRSPHC